jgi:CMP-N,N'-diacetyllegionaminic acid synthase
MTTLTVIPARGGSKGLPGKNIIDFGGRPLIHWTIAAALDSGVCGRIIVSTDDQSIAQAAIDGGAAVPFMRPAALATDEANSLDVVRHAIEASQEASGATITTIVLLQPTSPLRDASDIVRAYQLFSDGGGRRPVVSVSPVKFQLSWIFDLAADGRLSRAFGADMVANRRQDSPQRYMPNGAIYIADVEAILSGRGFFEDAQGYVMPRERSVDIDDADDLELARFRLASVSRS